MPRSRYNDPGVCVFEGVCGRSCSSRMKETIRQSPCAATVTLVAVALVSSQLKYLFSLEIRKFLLKHSSSSDPLPLAFHSHRSAATKYTAFPHYVPRRYASFPKCPPPVVSCDIFFENVTSEKLDQPQIDLAYVVTSLFVLRGCSVE